MIAAGRIPYAIIHTAKTTTYRQVDASDEETAIKIRELKKDYYNVETEYVGGKTTIRVWRTG